MRGSIALALALKAAAVGLSLSMGMAGWLSATSQGSVPKNWEGLFGLWYGEAIYHNKV